MREIKFRARPCYTVGRQPAWVYGTFQYIAQRRVSPGATDNGRLEPRVDKGRIVDIYGAETEVLCDTVGQYTGLKDKNGVEIYEGDVLYDSYSDNRFEVRFDDGSFDVRGILERDGCYLNDVVSDSEVIGNIHDNPELLKGKEYGV